MYGYLLFCYVIYKSNATADCIWTNLFGSIILLYSLVNYYYFINNSDLVLTYKYVNDMLWSQEEL